MPLPPFVGIFQTAAELGLISSITVLALFLSYSMLNICDLSTDGCFALGAAVGAMVAISSGNPLLSILAAMLAGVLSGFVTAFLQTKMGINSLLSGIIVNTGLYSIIMLIMGGRPTLNMNNTDTYFTPFKMLLDKTPFAGLYKTLGALVAVTLVIVFLSLFLRTRLGLAIRATGNNPAMVRSSSINPAFTTTVGLCISGSLTALSGCLLAQCQKSVSSDIGSGRVTIALASLLIGGIFISARRKIPFRAIGAVLGAIIFQLVYAIALRFNMPAYMLKLVSAVIVILAIATPYLNSKRPDLVRRFKARRNGTPEVPANDGGGSNA
ncbi:MAG: ABC transporter permease [Clostridia bacterium]|nr:ABC transporter permease [Clostridia bacterium]